ncbi:MAG TPA: DoxX family protein [Polyangiaceae bacterium]|nr:DoxX family protein [Polyangiaceae bacterium]
MNIILWISQILLSLHTLTGAVWKYSNSEQSVPSLKAIPHGVWLGLGVVEILCALALVVPILSKSLGVLTPLAAGCIVAEMLIFCGLHIYSGDKNYGPVAYWLVVAAIGAFIVYGRTALKPL